VHLHIDFAGVIVAEREGWLGRLDLCCVLKISDGAATSTHINVNNLNELGGAGVWILRGYLWHQTQER
jgi:hypothetical protein